MINSTLHLFLNMDTTSAQLQPNPYALKDPRAKGNNMSPTEARLSKEVSQDEKINAIETTSKELEKAYTKNVTGSSYEDAAFVETMVGNLEKITGIEKKAPNTWSSKLFNTSYENNRGYLSAVFAIEKANMVNGAIKKLKMFGDNKGAEKLEQLSENIVGLNAEGYMNGLSRLRDVTRLIDYGISPNAVITKAELDKIELQKMKAYEEAPEALENLLAFAKGGVAPATHLLDNALEGIGLMLNSKGWNNKISDMFGINDIKEGSKGYFQAGSYAGIGAGVLASPATAITGTIGAIAGKGLGKVGGSLLSSNPNVRKGSGMVGETAGMLVAPKVLNKALQPIIDGSWGSIVEQYNKLSEPYRKAGEMNEYGSKDITISPKNSSVSPQIQSEPARQVSFDDFISSRAEPSSTNFTSTVENGKIDSQVIVKPTNAQVKSKLNLDAWDKDKGKILISEIEGIQKDMPAKFDDTMQFMKSISENNLNLDINNTERRILMRDNASPDLIQAIWRTDKEAGTEIYDLVNWAKTHADKKLVTQIDNYQNAQRKSFGNTVIEDLGISQDASLNHSAISQSSNEFIESISETIDQEFNKAYNSIKEKAKVDTNKKGFGMDNKHWKNMEFWVDEMLNSPTTKGAMESVLKGMKLEPKNYIDTLRTRFENGEYSSVLDAVTNTKQTLKRMQRMEMNSTGYSSASKSMQSGQASLIKGISKLEEIEHAYILENLGSATLDKWKAINKKYRDYKEYTKGDLDKLLVNAKDAKTGYNSFTKLTANTEMLNSLGTLIDKFVGKSQREPLLKKMNDVREGVLLDLTDSFFENREGNKLARYYYIANAQTKKNYSKITNILTDSQREAFNQNIRYAGEKEIALKKVTNFSKTADKLERTGAFKEAINVGKGIVPYGDKISKAINLITGITSKDKAKNASMENLVNILTNNSFTNLAFETSLSKSKK